MPEFKFQPQNDPGFTNIAQRVNELRAALADANPLNLSKTTGAVFCPSDTGGEFVLRYWNDEIYISYPSFIAWRATKKEELSTVNQALLLYYFTKADGTPPQGRWISFAELPDGRFYHQAFQGYTGEELKRHFRDKQTAFNQAALRLGGKPFALGDDAFTFQILPRITTLVVLWKGDEDFPPSFQVLFDATANHYLPTDAYAILGSMLTRKLISISKDTPR